MGKIKGSRYVPDKPDISNESMKLHVLILTHNFVPEFTGAATMQYELARFLVVSGHTVTVITSTPDHHMVDKQDRKIDQQETIDGIRVIRIKPPRLSKSTLINREINALMADFLLVMKGLRIKPVDILFMLTPPVTLPIFAALIKKIRKSISIMYLQDVFPEFLISMNVMTRSNILFRIAKRLEMTAYKKASCIGVHSPKNKAYVVDCGIDEKKVRVIPLWVDTEFLASNHSPNDFIDQNKLQGKFVVMYAGTVGFAMGAKTIPQTAKFLEREKDIQIVVVGEGSKIGEMQAEMDRLKINNVLLLSPRPREELPKVLSSSDILLVLLRKEMTDNPNGYFNAVIPHKLLTNMAVGKPVLLSAEIHSDAAELVRQSNCGKIVSPEDPEALAQAIVEMKRNRSKLSEYAQNGRKFAVEHFNSLQQVQRMEEFFVHLKANLPYEFDDPWKITE